MCIRTGKLAGVGRFSESSVGMNRLSVSEDRFGQSFCGNSRDWSDLLQERLGLAKFSVGPGGIGQFFCESRQSGQNLL